MNLYIINDSCSGAMYGIGTYIQELITSLKGSDINICVINLYSELPQITTKEKNNIRYWYFPKPIEEPRTTSNKKQWKLYYRNIIFLLQLHVKDKKDLVFHLNYNYDSNFPKELKKTFNCRIVTSIHYLDWCMKTNGNASVLRQILSDFGKEPVDDMQKSIYKSYLKEKRFFEAVDLIISLSNSTLTDLDFA